MTKSITNAIIWAYFTKPKKRTLKEVIPIVIAKWKRFNKVQQRAEKVRQKTKDIKLNFKNAKYSVGGTYYFPYSFETATKIVKSAVYFNSAFSFLQSHMFIKDSHLNLHRSSADYEEANNLPELDSTFEIFFEESEINATNLSQDEYFKTLKIHDWPYSEFVTSATFFYLHNLFLQHSKINSPVPVFSKLKGATGLIAQLILSPIFGDNVFDTVKQTNLFIKYPFECIVGFSAFIRSECLMDMYQIKNCKSLCSRIEETFKGDFSRLKYYLSAFNFMIPYSLIKYVNAYCIETKSISLIYYTLKQYENALNPEITKDDQSLENFVLSKFLDNEINLLKTVGLPNSSQLQLFLMGTSILLLQNSILLSAVGFINPLNPNLLQQILSEDLKNPQPATVRQAEKQAKVREAKIQGLRGRDLEDEYKTKGWQTERPKGLVIAKKNNVRSVIGNIGPFKHLKAKLTDNKKVLSSGSQIPYQVDHFNGIANRTYGGIKEELGYAACSPSEFNQTRFIARGGLNLGNYTDWKDLSFSDFVYNQQQDTFDKGWKLYETRPQAQAERDLLIKNGLLDMLPNIYAEGKYLALTEMRTLADIFNLGDGSDATAGVFLIPSLLEQLDSLTVQLEKKTAYKSTNKQIPLNIAIRDALEYRWHLVTAIKSFQSALEPRGQYTFSTYITDKLVVCDSKVLAQANLSVNNYSSCFEIRGLESQDLDQIKSDIKEAFERKFTSADMLGSMEELWIRPEFQVLNIGEFGFTENFPKLNVTGNEKAFPQICNEFNAGLNLSKERERKTNEVNTRVAENRTYLEQQEKEQKTIEQARKQQTEQAEPKTSKEQLETNIAATTSNENSFDVNPKAKPSETEKAALQEPQNIETLKQRFGPRFFENNTEWLDAKEEFERDWINKKLREEQENAQRENIEASPRALAQESDTTKEQSLEASPRALAQESDTSKEQKQTAGPAAYGRSTGQESLNETGKAFWKYSQDQSNENHVDESDGADVGESNGTYVEE